MAIEYKLKKMLGIAKFELLEKLVNKVYEVYPDTEIEIIDEHTFYQIKFILDGKVICMAIAMNKELDFAIVFNKIEEAKFNRQKEDFSKSFQRLVEGTTTRNNVKMIRYKFYNQHLLELDKILKIKQVGKIKIAKGFIKKS